MSGLSKINLDRIDSHAAVTTLCRAIAEVIKNPPDMKNAVEDAHKIIQQAKDDLGTLKAEKLRFNAETAAANNALDAKRREQEDLQKKIDSESRTISLRMQELESTKVVIETRKSELSAQDERSRVREEAVKQREDELQAFEKKLQVFEATLKGKEDLIQEKERSISDREGKLRQILG